MWFLYWFGLWSNMLKVTGLGNLLGTTWWVKTRTTGMESTLLMVRFSVVNIQQFRNVFLTNDSFVKGFFFKLHFVCKRTTFSELGADLTPEGAGNDQLDLFLLSSCLDPCTGLSESWSLKTQNSSTFSSNCFVQNTQPGTQWCFQRFHRVRQQLNFENGSCKVFRACFT